MHNNPLSQKDSDGHFVLNSGCSCNVDYWLLYRDFVRRTNAFTNWELSVVQRYFGKKPVVAPVATPTTSANTATPNPDDRNKKPTTGAKPKVLQTGSNTIRKTTAEALNKAFGENLEPREWGRALESLKNEEGLPNDFHGKILSNGDVSGEVNGVEKTVGNIGDYIP